MKELDIDTEINVNIFISLNKYFLSQFKSILFIIFKNQQLLL